MQIEQQSQITTEKENVPPRILKEIPTNNISKSLSTMIRVQKLQQVRNTLLHSRCLVQIKWDQVEKDNSW